MVGKWPYSLNCLFLTLSGRVMDNVTKCPGSAALLYLDGQFDELPYKRPLQITGFGRFLQ